MAAGLPLTGQAKERLRAGPRPDVRIKYPTLESSQNGREFCLGVLGSMEHF